MSATFDIANVAKARNNLLAIYGDQGYNVAPYTGATVSEVAAMIEHKQLDMTLEHPNFGTKVHVHFHHGKGPRSSAIHDLVDDLYLVDSRLEKSDDLMIVSGDAPNETLLRVLRSIWAKNGIYVSVVGIANLQFNILRNHLVPPHRRLSEEEANEVLAQFNVEDNSQLPAISRFDPVAQLIGLRPGDLCEIVRKSPTAMSSVFYRICCP